MTRQALRSEARERLRSGLPVTERQLKLNGVPTTVLEGGAGPPLVLLHGPGEYAESWFAVIPVLARTHCVIAPDLPGHGASGAVDGPLDVALMAGWLDDLIECTCSNRPVLVGQTLGGAIAARFAGYRGDGLERVVLVDSLGLAPFQPTPEFGRALSDYLANPTEDTHDGLWRRCAFDLDAMRTRLGERWEWIKEYNLDRARTPGLGPTQHALMEQFGFPGIPADELARIRVPTSLIWGRHDLATKLEVAVSVAQRHGWSLHVIESAADAPHVEQPEAFVRALRAAIDGV